MPSNTWTIEVTEKDLQVLRRNMDAMKTLLREQQLAPDLLDDFHQCVGTLEAMLERVRQADKR
jgi:SMC interacting uncharacterized protein involved in chromosome segregation